jgi:hypothetical protein
MNPEVIIINDIPLYMRLFAYFGMFNLAAMTVFGIYLYRYFKKNGLYPVNNNGTKAKV